MPDDDTSNLFTRIGQVEQQIAGLASTVEGIAESVQQSNRQIARLADDTRTTLERRTQTQWSPLIGAAGLIIAILGSLFSVVAFNQDKRIDEVVAVVKSLSSDFHNHEKSYGHLATTKSVEAHTKELASLDTVLQREMVLLNSEIKATIEGNERRLQEEMELMRDSNQLRSEGLNSIQVEQIKALERIVFSDDAQWDRVIQAIKEIAGD